MALNCDLCIELENFINLRSMIVVLTTGMQYTAPALDPELISGLNSFNPPERPVSDPRLELAKRLMLAMDSIGAGPIPLAQRRTASTVSSSSVESSAKRARPDGLPGDSS